MDFAEIASVTLRQKLFMITGQAQQHHGMLEADSTPVADFVDAVGLGKGVVTISHADVWCPRQSWEKLHALQRAACRHDEQERFFPR